MQDFIDRLGKVAQQTASDTRLRLAVRTLGGKLDERAQALGDLVFRRHQGEAVAEEDILKVLKEMSDLKAEREAKEAEIEALHKAPAADEPSPAPDAPAAEEAPANQPPSDEAPSEAKQA